MCSWRRITRRQSLKGCTWEVKCMPDIVGLGDMRSMFFLTVSTAVCISYSLRYHWDHDYAWCGLHNNGTMHIITSMGGCGVFIQNTIAMNTSYYILLVWKCFSFAVRVCFSGFVFMLFFPQSMLLRVQTHSTHTLWSHLHQRIQTWVYPQYAHYKDGEKLIIKLLWVLEGFNCQD